MYLTHEMHAQVDKPWKERADEPASYEERLQTHMAEEERLLLEADGLAEKPQRGVVNPHPNGCFHCGQSDHLSQACPLMGVPYS